MTERTLRVEIQRYQPEDDEPPYWQGYNVPCEEHWVLLDALNYIKDHLDGTLSYRWSCHMAVCGSCGMVVDGDPMLACKTFVRDLPDTVHVTPLSNLPVERDLIVDQDRFMTSLSEVSPWVIPAGTPPEDAECRQSPQELARFRQYSMCINCLLCYAACPQVGLNPGYLGPAALALAHRYNLDSRDDGRLWRAEVTGSENGVWECTFVGECSEVCPKHVDPAGAIQQMKLANSLDWLTAPLRRKQRS